MTCFECGIGDLIEGVVELEGQRDGEVFPVSINGLRCDKCGFSTIDSSASGEFTRLLSDAYRTKHGLLRGIDIKARREHFKMSQQEFADYLSVGVASVKRWELGQVQDRAMDALLRLKTDPEAARNNLRELEQQVPTELVSGENLNLLFASKQVYGRRPQMKIEQVKIDEAWEEPLAA